LKYIFASLDWLSTAKRLHVGDNSALDDLLIQLLI